MNLLVIADIHFAPPGRGNPVCPQRRCELGAELLRRTVDDASRRGGIDAIALLGDLIDNGQHEYAEGCLRRLRTELDEAAPGVPILAVFGNHDVKADLLFEVFDQRPGTFEICGYRFVTFADRYAEDAACTRSEMDRRRCRRLAREGSNPIVVLQHNPMNPPIAADYPYMLTNRDEVMRDYAEAGVMLAMSGHYHQGQAPSLADGVQYFTAPALCETPYRYALVTLQGQEATVEVRQLCCDDEYPLVDRHVHTEFAYCAQDVTAAGAIERARTFGLAGVSLIEHAPQLYCRENDYWSGGFIRRPGLWRSRKHSRMAEFRRAVLPLRSDFVRVGMEVELDADGQVTLRRQDRDGLDLLVGAVHFLPEDVDSLGDAGLAMAFMRTSEGLLEAGVDVLAHPWRFFGRTRQKAPTELYVPLADALAATGTAAEINFHGNAPDPAFFTICAERGVKIALGSDAHRLDEVGNFPAYVDMLRRIAGDGDISDLLM